MKLNREQLIEKMGIEKIQMLDKRLSKHWFNMTAEEREERNKSDAAWHEFVGLCSNMDSEDFADTMREFEVENNLVLEEIITDCIG